MPISVNSVHLGGNLTKDPTVRTSQSGSKICSFSMAINEKYKDQEDTVFVDVTVFGKQAEVCSQYLSKGSEVYVDGRLKFEQWQDRNGGGTRQKLSVNANRVQFIGSKREQQQPQQEAPRRGVDPACVPPVNVMSEHQQAKANGYQPEVDDLDDYVPF